MKRLIRQYVAILLILANAVAVTGCGISPETQRHIIVTCAQVVCDIYSQHAIQNRRDAAPSDKK